MLTIDLDASGWQRPTDFYRDLLTKLGGPSWHGHNLDAINDSILGCDINKVEPPFKVIVHNSSAANESLQQLFREFAILVKDLRTEAARQVYFEYA